MGNWVIGLLNSMISGLAAVLSAILFLLPSSPIQAIDNSSIVQYLGYVNWIIPISAMVTELGAFCIVVLIYYGYQIVLRWGKVLE